MASGKIDINSPLVQRLPVWPDFGFWTGEAITEEEDNGQKTLTNANKLYDLGFDTGVLNGTNRVALLEFDCLITNTNPENVVVNIYRHTFSGSEVDGNTAPTASEKIHSFRMLAGSRVRMPYFLKWGTKNIMAATATSGVVLSWDARVAKYTPA